MERKILFVDDDKLVARIYGEKLAEDGFEVVVAEDGVMAMKQMVEFKPDLVVLDLLMPKLNGADVLKFIRGNAQLKATHVIVFSNSFLAALVEQVGALGVDGVLPESSATPARLIELIHQVFSKTAPAVSTAPPVASSGPAKPPAQPSTDAKSPPGAGRTAENKDEHFRERVQEEFVKHLPRVLTDIRQLSRGLLEADDPKKEIQLVEHLSRKVGFLTQMASMAKCAELAQLANALELLFFHLHEKQGAVNDSCRNTIASAVAFLTQRMERFQPTPDIPSRAPSVLVVDDDAVSNRGIVHALTHANFAPSGVTDATKALEKLKQTSFDLIILDVELPGMDGMALCEEIRRLERHRKTPVIFITGHRDGKTRARSILSGGNEFITKPFLPIELTVKLITLMLKSRIGEETSPT